jgi:hypothetical protein
VWRQQPKIGDVFQIPVDEEHVAYGQVLSTADGMPHLVVFDGLYEEDEDVDLDKVVRQPVILYSWSTGDRPLKNGKWRIVGNRALESSAAPPVEFVEMQAPEEFVVIDWAGKVLRRASAAEVENAPFRATRDADVLQKATEAWHGRQPWSDRYLDLRPWDERNAEQDNELTRLLKRFRS